MPLVRIPNSEPAFQGVPYLHFIGTVCKTLSPRTYIEIGTNTGGSLTQIDCDAVCIDPEFRFASNPAGKRTRTLLFQMSSDDFFRCYDLGALLPEGVDLAFLDGMHRFEFLLRDLINIETYCGNRSLVLLHDCLPTNPRMAERTPRHEKDEDLTTRHSWTGDVWKLLPILKKYRPDLRIHLIDCPPTGLVAITNLHAKNTILSDSILCDYG